MISPPSLLLAVALKGAVVLALAALAVWTLRHAPASTRHGIWAAAFGALLLLPVLEAFGPHWAVSVLPASAHPPAVSAPLAPPAPPAPPAHIGAIATTESSVFEVNMTDFEADMADFEVEMGDFEADMVAFERGMEETAWAAARPAVSVRAPASSPWTFWTSPVRWLLAVWAAGALVVGLGWISAFASASCLLRDAEPETDPEWAVLAERARRLSGLSEPVRLLRTDRVDVPVAWGWGRPAVVLPASADSWSDDRREAVLLHEMAHLRRRDAWTQMAAQAAVALHWLNPLAWLAYRQFLEAREQACDDAVIQGGARPSAYAEHLVGVARGLRRDPVSLAALAPMARCAPLEGRVRSILDASRRRGRLSRPALAGTAALTLFGIVPLAAFQPVERDAEAPVSITVDAPVGAAVDEAVAVVPDTLDAWHELDAAIEEIEEMREEVDRLAGPPLEQNEYALAELDRWHRTGSRGSAAEFGASEADWKRALSETQREVSTLDLKALQTEALVELAAAVGETEGALAAVKKAVVQHARADVLSTPAAEARHRRDAKASRTARQSRTTSQTPAPMAIPSTPPSLVPRVAPAPSPAPTGFDWNAVDRARRNALRRTSSPLTMLRPDEATPTRPPHVSPPAPNETCDQTVS